MAGPKVLVAEPDASQRQIVEMLLLVNGFDVTFAHNGREALEFLKDNNPDLVIVSAQLPQVNGYDLARKVRGVRRLRSVPVILVAPENVPLDQARSDGQLAGADLVLSRPLGDKNLGERAKSLIERAALEAQSGRPGQQRNRTALTSSRVTPAVAPPTAPPAGSRPVSVTDTSEMMVPVLSAVSSGEDLDPHAEIAQLRKVVAELSSENTELKRQLTATGRSTQGGAEVISDLRRRLKRANEQLEEYRKKYPDLIDVKATGTFGTLFRRKN